MSFRSSFGSASVKRGAAAIVSVAVLAPSGLVSAQLKSAQPQISKPASDQASEIAAPQSSAQQLPKAKPATPPVPDLNGLVDFSRVYSRAAENGVIHSLARNYKAQFSPAGITYSSRDGEHLTLSLQSASVGGRSLKLDAHAQPALDGNSISIDRGALVEHYELTPDSVEQLFTVNHLNQKGDLVLTIAASMPSMIANETTDSLQFAGSRGAINYSKAVLVDNANARTNLSTTVTNGVIEIRVPESVLSQSQFPITVDPVISSGLAYGLTSDYGNADVAFDVTNNHFAVVFEYNFSPVDGDIVSLLLDSAGVIVPNSIDFPDFTNDNWRNPSVANNNIANVFMVAAERGFTPARGIWGNTINPATGVVGSQFEMINGGGGEKTNPDIGGDSLLFPPTYFMVVWEWAFAAGDHEIAGRLFTAAGTQQGGEIFLDLSADNQTNPAISKSNLGNKWMIVWQSTFGPGDEDIHAAVVHWDGTVSQPATVLDFSGVNHTNPDVSSNFAGDHYLAAYEANGAIALRLTNIAAASLDAATLESLGDNPFSKPRYEPCVDSDGDKCIVGYSEQFANDATDWDFYASTVCADNDNLKLAEMHRNLDYGAWRDQQSAVATNWSAGGSPMSGATFAWTHDITPVSNGFGTIFSGRYNGPSSCCPADVAPFGGNGTIDVDDLLTVINQWTSSTCLSCTGDVNGDAVVDVDDLLAVINDWGLCQ